MSYDTIAVYDKDVMIDLETTGISGGCCILSLGACTLDTQHIFYSTISHASCLEFGLRDDHGTLAWWDKQDPAIRREAFSGFARVEDVLAEFYQWYNDLPGLTTTRRYWSNGADFDIPILNAAYMAVRQKSPLQQAPFNGRCYRTVRGLYIDDIKSLSPRQNKHNALEDALFQAKILREALYIHTEHRRLYNANLHLLSTSSASPARGDTEAPSVISPVQPQ